MPSTSSSTSSTLIDFSLQVLEQILFVAQKLRPILQELRGNEQIIQILRYGQDLYAQLPEQASLALTVALVFFTSLTVFKVGRSLISIIVTAIQMILIVLVAVVVWNLRGPLGAWLENILNQ